MMTEFPLVSLITVNYIHLRDTIEFLESAEKLTYPNIEIIVVDNGSPEGKPTEDLKKKYPAVFFIESEKNVGFAGGNNLGMKVARGHFFFLLNNDTVLLPGFMEPIIDFMLAHPDAGMASPKVLYPNAKILQYVGATHINPFTGRGKIMGLMEQDNGQYNSCYKTQLAHGAALIVPRKVVEKVGLMPEVYFLYYEEHDWCEMVKRAGFSMYYIGTSKVLHKESVSTGSGSPLKTYYLTRNRLLFMRRNFHGFPFVFGMVFFFTISIAKNSAMYVLKGQFNLLKAFYRGIGWNVNNFVRTLFSPIQFRINSFQEEKS
jgi:GT2 family glycosyltransferase